MSTTININLTANPGLAVIDDEPPLFDVDGTPVGEDNNLSLDDPEPAIGSVVMVSDRRGEWLAFRTTDGWIAADRWVGDDYHNWFTPQSRVYLMVSPQRESE